jgi:CelD/BcsL family acetyltransferase involved in cellulose biosynthesis
VLAVETLRDRAAIRRLSSEWEALCDASPGASPFQRPGWAIAWLDRFDIQTPHVLAVREGGDLVGLLPGFVWGPPEERVLSLLGAGPSDHLDAVAAPGFARGVLDALGVAMAAHPGRPWSACAFDEIGPSALLRELPAPPGTRSTSSPQSVCPVLDIGGRDGALERVVPLHQAGRWRKARRKCERLGAVRFERADRGDAPAALRVVFELQVRRWAHRGVLEAGCFADPRVIAMHEQAALEFARRGSLRLYLLRVGGRPAAGVYGFREKSRLHLYAQGSEPEFAAASPGLVVLGEVVVDALREGLDTIDFLRGGEAYKYDWGAVDEENVRLTLAPATPGHAG